MLLLMAPSFEITPPAVQRLAEAVGVVPYDLKRRLKAGSWSLVAPAIDAQVGTPLADRLRQDGFPAELIDPSQLDGDERRAVPVTQLRVEHEQLTFEVRGESMPIRPRALAVLALGVLGDRAGAGSGSSSFAAEASRPPPVGRDEVHVLDIHFHRVAWIARVDPRLFALHEHAGATGHPVRDLEALAERLARATGARLDRGYRHCSLAQWVLGTQHGAPPATRPEPSGSVGTAPFDRYSRLLGEAERVWCWRQRHAEAPAAEAR